MQSVTEYTLPHGTPISFPIKLRLRYEVMDRRWRGEGCTVSISSTEIVFEALERLPVGTPVKLCIDWPVKLENRINLTLAVTGKTVQGQQTTLKILRYEFRIRPSAVAAANGVSIRDAARGACMEHIEEHGC